MVKMTSPAAYGLWALESIEHNWIMHKRASRSLASLFLYEGALGDDCETQFSVFDNIRNSIANAKSSTSIRIEKNNGIATRNLRALFRPLGIDVPEDPQLTGSLELLVSLRHQWAHQYRYGAKVAKFASDIKNTSDDCLILAERLAKGAKSVRP